MTPFERYPAMASLPTLVRKQRRLEKRLAPLDQAEKDEKAVRASIDALLIAEGFAKGEGVTCLGYDVVHREREGNQFISRDLLIAAGMFSREKLLAAGVDVAVLDACLDVAIIDACVDRHKKSEYATVNPTKGASVRVRTTAA